MYIKQCLVIKMSSMPHLIDDMYDPVTGSNVMLNNIGTLNAPSLMPSIGKLKIKVVHYSRKEHFGH